MGDGICESGYRANIWLACGSEQDAVMDVGLGLRSLLEYLCTPPASCRAAGPRRTHLAGR